MTKINVRPDCGNAPRKSFLKEFNTALAKGVIKFLDKAISEDISYEIVGHIKIAGKEKYLNHLPDQIFWKVKELTIDTIITHGADASVSGQIKTKDNQSFKFCDVYRFKSAGGMTILSIDRFLVHTEGEKSM
jgi:hypothetical protein